MSLYDDLKARVTAAVKGGDTRTRDALRTVLGEAQAEAVRRKGEVTDEVVLGVVRKAVAGLKETIPLAKRGGRDTTEPEAELALLESLLPRPGTGRPSPRRSPRTGTSYAPPRTTGRRWGSP